MQTHPTQILASDPSGLDRAAELLRAGEVIGLPTETVYGLAGHAFDEQAVLRIFAAKERPSFDPLIVHLSAQMGLNLSELTVHELIDPELIPSVLRPALEHLIKAYWPGPLTLVLPRHQRVPDLVTSGLPTVALRVPSHPVAQSLLAMTFPLAAPSANRFGRISPTDVQAVYSELAGRIPLILDGGPCEIGLESTVVGIDGESLCLLRPGRLGAEELSAIAGLPVITARIHPAEVLAPGMLKSHYAPKIPLFTCQNRTALLEQLVRQSGRPGLLLLAPADQILQTEVSQRQGQIENLNPDGSLEAAARGLFSAMRRLDLAADFILAELPAAETGLGHAIRDRLGKAAAR